MKMTQSEFERIISAWRRAYHEKENLEISDSWQARVMLAVREVGTVTAKTDPLALFGQLVWRLAPVMTLLIIASAALLLAFGLRPGDSLLVSWMTGAEESSISQLLPL